MQTKPKFSCLIPALFLAFVAASVHGAELIPLGSTWKHRLGTSEASSPISAWRQIGFDDSTWASGAAPIGYDTGGTPGTAPIVTLLPDPREAANPAWTNTYFRKTFNVAQPASITDLSLTLLVDDGAVAWLNGIEIARINVPDGELTHVSASVVADETRTMTTTNIASHLVAGNNVLSVHAFNGPAASSDFVFEASLTAMEDEAPTVINLDPPATASVQSLAYINVVFSEGVSGVNASDLLVNSVAATNVLQINPREYTFYFATSTTTGTVTAAWAVNPAINDLDGLPTPFVPEPSWTYTVDPTIVPAQAVISEFMADNESGLEDDDGSRSDWIEIYNPGLVEVGLDGWYLTDTTTNLAKWRIPSVVIGPNKYLLIWASEKNRANPAAPLHTNFRLSRNAGSYLALVNPSGTVVSSFGTNQVQVGSLSPYPPQFTDVSYGRDRVSPSLTGYFESPTPRAQNATSGNGFTATPTTSHESGVYTNASINFVLSSVPGATIRYTLNGTLPTNGSPEYSGPITVQNNTTIKFRAFPSGVGSFPSAVQVRNFLFLDNTTRDFNSNLPVLILSSEGRPIPPSVVPGGARAKGTFVVFDTFRGRSTFSRKPDYIGPADFEIFGQSSQGFAKQPFNIEIQDALGNDKAESILGLPAEADWKLRNPFSDKCLMNDFLAYEMFEQMGNYSCRRRFVEVFVDSGGGRLTYPGDYIGVEVMFEKIERGDNRVDIAELTPAHTNEPAISGGWIFRREPGKESDGDLNFTAGGNTLKLTEPKPQSMRVVPITGAGQQSTWPGPNYTPSASNQLSYLVAYLNRMNASMAAVNFTNTGTNHYSHYVDVDKFVDQHWIVEFPKQIDGYRLSDFFTKDRNGKVKPEPIWDWNLSFGNADYLDGGNTNTWYYTLIGAADHVWLRPLLGAAALPNSGGDPDFIQKVIDRWGVLRTNVMNGDRVVARIDEIATLLTDNNAASSPVTRNFSKHNNLNTYLWPNPQGPPAFHVDYTQPTYAGIISEMKKWTMGRYLWIDSQLPKAPTLGIPEGNIAAGSTLAISAPAGTLYYTLDGTDPRRTKANGAVSSNALTYSAPVTLNANARVFARARVGTTWSPPAIASYVVQQPRLVITEIMYHPLPPGNTNNIDEDFEYLEVKNVGATPLNVGGFTISGGVDFTFPTRTLAAGERAVVVANRYAFTNRYGASNDTLVAGEFTGNLANEGNRLTLHGSLGEPILDFEYDDQWHPITDGFGFSLVIVNDNAPVNTWGLASSWRPSGTLNGTPGQGDGAAPSIPRVVISEVLSHSDLPGPTEDIIELLNLSGGSASVGGWYLSDDFRDPKKFRIPLATPALPNGGSLTFDEGDFNSDPGEYPSFSLSSSGDEVYLFSADAAGELTGYVHGFTFGPQRTGVTFVRHVNSQTEEHFVAASSATLGTPNAPLLIGPIVITEIMYRPPDVFANGASWNNSEDEFVELRNISGGPVELFDLARPTNTWKLDNAVEFEFPPNITVPPDSYVMVVNFNPETDSAQLAAFRSKYNLSPSVPLFGPYSGDLSNGDETVALYRPDVPEDSGANAGEIPYVLVDAVHYSDRSPWPVGADGFGHSLQRIVESNYGNDPANWTDVNPSAGAPFISGGTPPSVTSQPAGFSRLSGLSGNLSVTASGTGPLSYQWRFNGDTLSDSAALSGANGPALTFPALQANQAGDYSVVIYSAAGSVESATARVQIQFPPSVALQPTNRIVRLRPDPNSAPTTNVTFVVAGTSGNSGITYQWRLNGVNIPGATSSTLTITDVQVDDEGDYSCAVSDSVATVSSAIARLTPWIRPIIVQPPLNQSVANGSDFSTSVEVSGHPLPMGYRWFRASTSLTGTTNDSRTNLVTLNTTANGFRLTNDTLTRVIVTNLMTNGVIVSTNYVTNFFIGTNFTLRIIVNNDAETSQSGVNTTCVITILPDRDLDGIPDGIEESLGMSTNNAADALGDLDLDGMNNRAEITAGTNPTNAASYLKIEGSVGAGQASVRVGAVAGRTYTVQYTDQLAPGVWLKLGDIPARSADRVETFVDTTWTTNRFYRVVLPWQP